MSAFLGSFPSVVPAPAAVTGANTLLGGLQCRFIAAVRPSGISPPAEAQPLISLFRIGPGADGNPAAGSVVNRVR